MQYGNTCPDWGCCCDHGRECCAGAVENGGNYGHLGERGGCRHIDVARIWDFWPQYIAGPRLPCGNWRCSARQFGIGPFSHPAFGFLGL